MHSVDNYSDRQPLILLLDDKTQALQELVEILTPAGYLTRCCTTAEEAFAAVQETRPDSVICNVVIREQSGLEICERLTLGMEPGEMPVMFLSANQFPDIIRRRGALGGSYYLRKPFDPAVLLDLLDKTLNAMRQPVLLG